MVRRTELYQHFFGLFFVAPESTHSPTVGEEDLELGLTNWPSAEQNFIERVSQLGPHNQID